MVLKAPGSTKTLVFLFVGARINSRETTEQSFVQFGGGVSPIMELDMPAQGYKTDAMIALLTWALVKYDASPATMEVTIVGASLERLLEIFGREIGLPVWVVVGLFLVLYNAGHLALRIWGFRSGLRDGRDVARTLSKARLAQLAERIKSIASLLVGVLAGVLLAGRGGLSDGGLLWLVVAIVCFVVGLVVGHRIWRPAAIATVTAIALIAAWGVLQ